MSTIPTPDGCCDVGTNEDGQTNVYIMNTKKYPYINREGGFGSELTSVYDSKDLNDISICNTCMNIIYECNYSLIINMWYVKLHSDVISHRRVIIPRYLGEELNIVLLEHHEFVTFINTVLQVDKTSVIDDIKSNHLIKFHQNKLSKIESSNEKNSELE